MLRIDSLAEKHPDELSGLQRQRVALARALASGPELLILDEPTGRLETRVRDEFRDELRRIHAETELTTLVLTHDPREALALADRLAVMDLGRIIQSGTPHEVYNRPADAFVARLLGPDEPVPGPGRGDRRAGRGRGPDDVRPADRPHARAIRCPRGPRSRSRSAPNRCRSDRPFPPTRTASPATVERLVFLGETRQVHLRGPGDWPIVALTLQSQSQGLREGQSLTLSVPPEQVVVLLGKYALPRRFAA